MKEIKSRKGFYLTQVAEVGSERAYVTAIKGNDISESDWREATKEERDAYYKAKEDERQMKELQRVQSRRRTHPRLGQ